MISQIISLIIRENFSWNFSLRKVDWLDEASAMFYLHTWHTKNLEREMKSEKLIVKSDDLTL